MGSGGCTNQVENCQNVPKKSPEKSSTDIVESCKEVVDETSSLGPITPDSDRENGDFPADHDSPPSSVKKMANVARLSSGTDDRKVCISPHTPKEGVFDPFAPGPEEKAMAPLCRKYASKSRSIIARRLSFDASIVVDDDAESVSDEDVVEALYDSLLETIVSKQTELVLAEISGQDWSSIDCRTPPSAPRLSGIAETCPGAPLRPGGKSRKVDSALCRRLQFSPRPELEDRTGN